MGMRSWCAVLAGLAAILGCCVGSADAGVSACAQPCSKGDVNNDSLVSELDIEPFLDVLLGLNTDPVAVCACDLNGDGEADGLDIEGLVASLLCGCGCTVETDCALGQNCVNGLCVPAGAPDIEVSDNNAPCVTTGYARLEDGGVYSICEGFQGLVELYLSIRTTGFAPNAVVAASYSLAPLNPQACTPSCPAGQVCLNGSCVLGDLSIPNAQLINIGGGVNAYQISDLLFLGVTALDGMDALLTVTLTDTNDPLITTSITLCVELNVFRFCFSNGDCQSNVCVGNYCQPS